MSFYGGNQNGAQPGSAQQQQIGRQAANPGLQNVPQVLTPQLFNINVNPNQLHNFFNEHNSSQNPLQLNAAAANPPSILLQTQQAQSFPVNIINDQLGVGVGQLITPASVPQGQMQGLPISMSSALNFPQTIHQVHAQTAPSQQTQAQNQQSKQQRVFTGTVTKIHDNFGFIDEEVFFQMGVVKGPICPKEGDRVLVEADFNASMPFKWNATRVQIVNMGGGMSSSLNSMSNLNSNQHSQSQHNIGFNSNMGMPKSSAPPPSVHTSQQNVRPHGGQPVTIVSNPHSVYSGANNPRGRAVGVAGATGAPPVAPLVPPQREAPKRPMNQMNIPSAPDPPPFVNTAGLMAERDRELERERERALEKARERSRERSRERLRDRSRDRARPRSRDRSRERARNNRSRERDKVARARSRSRDRAPRDRSRDRDRGIRGTSRDRVLRERSIDRSAPSRVRSRSRERSRDRNAREKSVDRRDRSKRDHTPDKSKDRDRARGKDREQRKKSPSPANKGNKDEPKKDTKKDKQSSDKRKPSRDRTPPVSHSQSSDRSKRSRSRESVRTDKVHPTEKSRSRSGSPRRKNVARPLPRYAVEIPKFSLDMKDINAKEMQRRYPNLYVPSDFFLAKSIWMETFPLHSPFELGHSCPVQIMRKGVIKLEIPDPDGLAEKFKEIPDVLEPADASFIFKAKVMIPSMYSLETLFRKACGVGEGDGPESAQHVDRLINFIVGMKTSKHEVMALGGPWSPSLDGPNPNSEPETLINTAIRSVRALAGINLSRCKHWYRFMELYYKRSNCLETVVYFLPDVWSCLPDAKEWSKLKSLYNYAVHGEKADLLEKDVNAAANPSGGIKEETNPLGPSSQASNANGAAGLSESGGNESVSAEVVSSSNKNQEINGDGGAQASTATSSSAPSEMNTQEDDDGLNSSGLLVIDEAASPCREEGSNENNRPNAGSDDPESQGGMDTAKEVAADADGVSMEDCVNSGNVSGTDPSIPMETSTQNTDLTEESNEDAAVANGDIVVTPVVTPSKAVINPKAMNVAQLREQLSQRHLSPKGLKAQLITRLTEALEKESAAEKEAEDEAAAKVQQQQNSQTSEGGHEEEVTNEESENSDLKMETTDVKNEVDIGEQQSQESTKIESDIKDEAEDEQCIRLVNPSLIFETQEDEDDDASMEDGELKECPDAKLNQLEKEFDQILSNFPAETFPIIKPGMKDEEVKMWERRYVLPKNPRLLMYPSATAKGGNFDCISMSLGLLRDYRIIDKKEDSFEVSLFSEFFHEMLQRDFAFRIYREIVTESVKTSTEDASEKEPEKEEKSEKDAVEPATKRRKLSTTSNVTTSSLGKKTTDPYLLLSFVFFDVTRCGYITETDLEDLCCCIGIGLTRAQVRKVVSKVVHKGTLYYRKWTDRPEKSKGKSDEEIRILAQGNMGHFPVFVRQNDIDRNMLSAVSASAESKSDSESVIAVVDGKSIDVKKLIEQAEKYEKDLAIAESSLNVMKNSLSEAKSQVSDLKKSYESQKEELSKTKEALKKSETSEKSTKENFDIVKRASERFFERIKDVVKIPTTATTTPTKDKSDAATKDPVKPKAEKSESKEKLKSSLESNSNDLSNKEKDPTEASA